MPIQVTATSLGNFICEIHTQFITYECLSVKYILNLSYEAMFKDLIPNWLTQLQQLGNNVAGEQIIGYIWIFT